MNIIIKETGEAKEIKMIDVNGVDGVCDFIGNNSFDALEYNDDDEVVMTSENYDWWFDLCTKYQGAENELNELKRNLDCVKQNDMREWLQDRMNCDLEDQPVVMLSTIEEFKRFDGVVTPEAEALREDYEEHRHG